MGKTRYKKIEKLLNKVVILIDKVEKEFYSESLEEANTKISLKKKRRPKKKK